MKAEAIIYSVLALATAAIGDNRLPPEQAAYLWSVAGTIVGAALSAANLQGTTGERWARAITSVLAGLIAAPWAIQWLPRGLNTPDWWHAFGASGLAAACGYILVTEVPPLVRRAIRGKR